MKQSQKRSDGQQAAPQQASQQTPVQDQGISCEPSGTCEHSVRDLAYQKWQLAGCPECDGTQFWFEAEQEISAGQEQNLARQS